ncbi:phage tail tape measure protein [Bacillus chungangensis]|uniref:TP901 family phage tail tape measure protein n=1 Tax=Bacillus chungangensis TaxID=587633 RepID=A0ABT9WNL1_9BACI|nr:phage tail tape measure protein [Bacillus chungangensis]MDQ0174375.1 TP901 family phage tail tape measure protein [Bacillus chungangensis]
MAIDLVAKLTLRDRMTAGLKRATAGLSGFEKQTKKSTSAAEKFSGVLAGFGVTLGAAAVAKSIIGIGAAFDGQMSRVKAFSQATDEEFEKMRATAKHLGETTVFTATQAGEGMEYLALAGWKVNEIIAGMPGMLNLAAAGALDLGQAADITSDTMQAFGISAEKATHVADVFAYAQANANTNVQQMGDAMNYLAPIANALGWGLEESSAALMTFGDSGLKGSMAGQAFATSLARLAKPTKQMNVVMKKLGIEFFDAQGNMKSLPEVVGQVERATAKMTQEQRSSVLTTLFGAQAYKHWAILLERGSDELANMTTQLENADGAAEKMAADMLDNLPGKFELFKSAMSGVALHIYEQIAPALTRLVEKATEFAGKLPAKFDAFIKLWPKIKDGLITAAVAVGTFKTAMLGLKMIKTVTMLMQGWRTATMAATIAQLGLNAAFWASPITWIVAGIAGLVAAGVLLYRNWDTVKAKAVELWGKTKEIFGKMGEWLKTKWGEMKTVATEKVVGMYLSAVEWFGKLKETMKEKVSSAIENVVTFFSELPSKVAEWLGFMFGVAVEWLSQFPGKFAEFMSQAYTNTAEWLGQLPGKVGEFLSNTWDSAVSWLSSIAASFGEWFMKAYDNAVEWVSQLPEKIGGFVSAIPGAVGGAISAVWAKFKELGAAIPKAIAEGFNGAKKAISGAASWAIDKLSAGISNFTDMGKKAGSSFSDGFGKGKKAVNGSHYHGLERVPYDGYVARMHKGERILNRKQADAFDNVMYSSVSAAGGTASKSNGGNGQSSSATTGGGKSLGDVVVEKLAETLVIREEADIDRIANQLARKIYEAGELGA